MKKIEIKHFPFFLKRTDWNYSNFKVYAHFKLKIFSLIWQIFNHFFIFESAPSIELFKTYPKLVFFGFLFPKTNVYFNFHTFILHLYTYFASLFVCLYPINVKTAEPIWPYFFVGLHMSPWFMNYQYFKN